MKEDSNLRRRAAASFNLPVDTNGLVGICTSTPAAGLQITSGADITTLSVVI